MKSVNFLMPVSLLCLFLFSACATNTAMTANETVTSSTSTSTEKKMDNQTKRVPAAVRKAGY